MSEEKRITTGREFGASMIAAYKSMPVTPENSKVVRETCWALLANVLASDHANGWNEAADRESDAAGPLLKDARCAVDKAMSAERPSSLAYYANGLVLRGEGDHRQARDAFQDAIAQDSKFARAHAQKSTELMYLGEFDEALKEIERAINLGSADHSLGIMKFNKGRLLLFKGDKDNAIKSFEEALDHRKNVWFTWLYLVSAYALAGEIKKAVEKLRKFRTQSGVKGAGTYNLDKVKKHERAIPGTDQRFNQARAKFYDELDKVFKNEDPPTKT